MSAFPSIDIAATGANIKKIRLACGLTIKDLQGYFGFEYPQAIYKWEWGECLPSVDNLYALSKLFKVPIDKILVGKDEDFNLLSFLHPFLLFSNYKGILCRKLLYKKFIICAH